MAFPDRHRRHHLSQGRHHHEGFWKGQQRPCLITTRPFGPMAGACRRETTGSGACSTTWPWPGRTWESIKRRRHIIRKPWISWRRCGREASWRSAVTWVNLAVLYEKAGRDGEIDGCLETAVEIFRSGEVPRDGYYAFNCRKCAETFGHFGYFRIKKELTETADRIYRAAGEEPGR